jgi:transposase
MEHLSDDALSRVKELGRCEFGVSKAWYLTELFKHFWNRRDKKYAQRYFEYWENEAATSGVEEMKKVARMPRKHLAKILSYFDSYITNAFSKGINSKIQAIKANARDFTNFKNYRILILFFCGKLSLAP